MPSNIKLKVLHANLKYIVGIFLEMILMILSLIHYCYCSK